MMHLLNQGVSHSDFMAKSYEQLRNEIYSFMRKNNLQVNWNYEFHFDMICDITDFPSCRIELTYGPKNHVPLWKVLTYLEKRKQGLLTDEDD